MSSQDRRRVIARYHLAKMAEEIGRGLTEEFVARERLPDGGIVVLTVLPPPADPRPDLDEPDDMPVTPPARPARPARRASRCAADIVLTLGEADSPLTTERLIGAMERAGRVHGTSTVKNHLARMRANGLIANDGGGYFLED